MTAKERELRAYLLGRAHGMVSAQSTLTMRVGLSSDDLRRDVARHVAQAIELANDPARARLEGWEVPS